jgi:hypothetical protein
MASVRVRIAMAAVSAVVIAADAFLPLVATALVVGSRLAAPGILAAAALVVSRRGATDESEHHKSERNNRLFQHDCLQRSMLTVD